MYVQSDTLLLADVFENFRNMCIKVYELDPAHFLSAPRLAWQACLKKTGVELQLLTDLNMLLTVEEGIRGRLYHAIHRYSKENNKYMKDYNKGEEESFLEYLDANNLYGWAMSEPLPVDGFDWIKDLSKIDEDFIKNYDKDSDKGYILEVDVILNIYIICIVIYHSYPKEWKLINATSLYAICMIKKLCCSHKIIKTSIKLWANIKEDSWSNTI